MGTPESEKKQILILGGPQHSDEQRPITGPLRARMESFTSLAPGILANGLQKAGIEATYLPMIPNRLHRLETVIGQFDAVLISARHFDTTLAQTVIRMANRLGVMNVSGGYGPTLNPKAYQEATSIVLGEAERLLNPLVADLKSGHLQSLYDATSLGPADLASEYFLPDRRFNAPKPFAGNRIVSLECSRGCPNSCTFCSATKLQQCTKNPEGKKTVRVRPVSQIIAEIEQLNLKPGDFISLVDINFMAIPEETIEELFKEFQSRGIRWIMEGTIKPLIDNFLKKGWKDSLFNLMSPLEISENGQAKTRKGGCWGFLYGVDDLTTNKVSGSRDKTKGLLEKALPIFRFFGIPLTPSFITGFDHHTFPESIFNIAAKIDSTLPPYSYVFIATPHPGTPFGDKIYREGRVFDDNTTHHSHRRVVHHPKEMSVHQLQQGYWWLLKHIYQKEGISRSIAVNHRPPVIRLNPFLAAWQMGIFWNIEGRATVKELELRGLFDQQLHQTLNSEYRQWKAQHPEFFPPIAKITSLRELNDFLDKVQSSC